jgi:uncharacterized RDD family membrane protein YckC
MVPPASAPSEFYERKRRLALVFAALSVGLMALYLAVGTFYLEIYTHPRAAWTGDSLVVLHRSMGVGEEEQPRSRLLALDEAFRVRAPSRALLGGAGAFHAEGEDITVYFGTQASVVRGGNTLRSSRLEQGWEVRSAVFDPWRGTAWVFGWRDGRIVARRRELGTYSEAIPVAEAGDVERLGSSVAPASGPLVAWRERGSTRVRTARFDGTAFRPGPDFDTGPVEHWDAVAWADRVLLATYHREDKTFKEVTFRVRCCEGCGRPPIAGRATFRDSVLIGRTVSGLAAAVAQDRLILVVTRPMTVQAAAVSLPMLRPDPLPAKLQAVGAEPLWRTLMGAFFPILMLFFSFSLVFLGFTLLRERSGFILERLSPLAREGPVPAEILQRAMAYILDLIVLFPPFFLAVEMLNVAPETADFDLSEPRWIATAGVWTGLHFLYHFAMEWSWGWTLGKRVIGIRVTELDGTKLRFRGALVRNLVRILDAEYPLGVFLGASVMMATGRRQRLGDLAARTMVVREAGRPGESRLKPRAPSL